MPGTEDNGDRHLLVILQRCQEVVNPLHPLLELIMLLAARQDALDNGGVAHVPGRSFRKLLTGIAATGNGGQGIARMPADGHDAAATVVVLDFLTHAGEGHAVEVLLVAHFNAAQLKAHDGRIVATDRLHVAGVLVVRPGETIERIVLMTEHDAFLPQHMQPVHQLFYLCFNGFLLRFLTTSSICRVQGCCKQ